MTSFRRYYENGLSVIPVKPRGKNPVILEWTKYCFDKATEAEIDAWESAKYSVGLACGPASGIVALDIDTDDEDFKRNLPLSPVVRRGKKGEVRFFKYREEIKSVSLPFIDILSAGRQVVLPPSIHPDGMPYVWITPDTLEDFNPSDLPDLDLSFLEKLKGGSTGPKIKVEGRNNKLVDIVSAMRGRGEPEDAIVNEVYEWDLRFHKPRLFTDSNERMKATNEDEAKKNAWNFVINVTKSLLNLGVIHFKDQKVIIQIDEIQEQKIIEKYKAQQYPEPSGMVKKIRDLILDFSERDMPNIALGGSVALMSAVASNRVRFNQCWSNTFILNLAPTGAGKSFPQRIISMILDERLGTALMGFGNYQSSSAFSKNLVSRRERIDVIDEVSSLFAQIKGGGLWQMGILEEMCKVWSSSSGKYSAPEYAEKEDTGTCYNPCVNVLGSSTLEGLKGSITKMMVTKGLIPRFLIFSHENYGSIKEEFLNEELLNEVTEWIGAVLKMPKPVNESVRVNVTQGPVFNPVNLAPTSQDAINLFNKIKLEFANRVETEESAPMKDMITRGKEQVMKLSLIHAFGNSRAVTTDDLIWGKKTFEVCLHNSKAFIEESAVDSDWEKDVQAIMRLFQNHSFVSTKLIANRIQRLQPQRVKAILEHLEIADKIQRVTKTNRGSTTHGFSLKS
jgi:hypothetical protein